MTSLLAVDFSKYSSITALLIGLLIIWSVAKPYRIVIVAYTIIVCLHAPPINTQYVTFALAVGPVSIHITDMLLLGMIICGLKILIVSPDSLLNSASRTYWLLMFLFLFWHVFRMFIELGVGGVDTQQVLRIVSGRFFVILVVLIPLYLVSARSFPWERIRSYILIVGALLPMFALINVAIQPEGLMLTSSGTKRYLIGTANIYMAICFILVIAGNRAKWFKSSTSIIYTIWILIGMVLTQHRSVVVALMVILFIDSLFCARAREKLIRIVGVLAISLIIMVGGVALSPKSGGLIDESVVRITDTFDSENATTKGRIDKWQKRLELFKQHPWIGSGFGRESADRRSKSVLDRQAGHEAHNFIISILTYEGVLGLIVNLSLLMVAFKHSWKYLRQEKNAGKEIPFLYLLFFITYSFFNTTYFNALTSPAYFVIIGVIAYIHKQNLLPIRRKLNARSAVMR